MSNDLEAYCSLCAHKGRNDENCNPAILMQAKMSGLCSGERHIGGQFTLRFFRGHTEVPADILGKCWREATTAVREGYASPNFTDPPNTPNTPNTTNITRIYNRAEQLLREALDDDTL